MTKVKMYNDNGVLRFKGESDDIRATVATFNSLQRNGTFVPGIENITINTPEEGKHQGSVHVKFKDGTKVTVKNMENDPFSAEQGLIYAIVKRLFGNIKDNDEVTAGSYMTKINDLLKKAHYPREEALAAETKAKEEAKAKTAAETKAKEEAKAEMKELIKEALKELGVTASESVVDKVKNVVKKTVKKSR